MTGAGTVAEHAPNRADEGWLRDRVAALASIHRPTASPGERLAAEWVVEELRACGAEVRIEAESSSGGYWWPLGLAAAAGVVAGVATLTGRRALGAALGAAACAAAIDDLPPRRRLLRRALPKRSASNVVGELGPADAERTVVLVAHHDAAHSGLVFHPLLPELADRAGFIERNDTSPPLMWPVVGAAGVAAAGAVTGSRALARLGTVVSAGVAAVMAEIGARDAVPGANDNASGVAAMLAVARALAERPTESVRVILLSTSEEATCEGMHHFADRHFDSLPRDRTFFLALDTVGSPHLCVLRGEGMLGVREYPSAALDLLDGLARELGIELFPNLRLRNATDGVYPLAAGYPCAALCSCTKLKQPGNYHWRSDVPDNVDYGSVADAARLTEAVVRRLDERWV
ncbi:MAG TPA: M28 family peptidase [Solirubrobacterales bacterium]|nr:M28 family peptidase [Solirubrobacterales bacterium]